MAPRSQPRLHLQNQPYSPLLREALLYTRIERHLVRANVTLLAHFVGEHTITQHRAIAGR